MGSRAKAIWNALIGITDRPRLKRRNRTPSKLGRRLRFEQCEDRRMLAVFMVDSMTDDGVGTTLREAIFGAVGSQDPVDTVKFDETVFANGGTILLTQGQLTINGSDRAL